MAEFQEVMRQWARMCEANSYCDNCPMQKEYLPYMLCSEGGIKSVENADDAERIIMSWAAEHPEPVYPTWEEWLQSVGVMESSQGLLRRTQSQLLIDGIPAHAIPTRKVLEPIPADIAEKLGIKPKEEG